MSVAHFKDAVGRPFTKANSAAGHTVRVFEFLEGLEANDHVLHFLQALRPSLLRVCREREAEQDWCPWRVSVVVDAADRILRIEQEVEVGVPAGVAGGSGLWAALQAAPRAAHVRAEATPPCLDCGGAGIIAGEPDDEGLTEDICDCRVSDIGDS